MNGFTVITALVEDDLIYEYRAFLEHQKGGSAKTLRNWSIKDEYSRVLSQGIKAEMGKKDK